jgi:mono/diheme cytochrome c family protein
MSSITVVSTRNFGAAPPESSFNPTAAARGEAIFSGKAQCAVCHVPPTLTEPGWNMHSPAEIGIDDFSG